jgi:hypothetical protein
LGDIELRTICIEARNRPDLFNVIYKENEDGSLSFGDAL